MGGGGRTYFPKAKSDLQKLVQQSKEQADKERLDGDVNQLLRETLANYERDPQETQKYMDEIESILKDQAEMERFLFGGSVAKHTYVDGLSDIDAMVILDKGNLKEETPQKILTMFHKMLRDHLFYGPVESVEKGKLAVTVKYNDGTEIQLLPAVRVDKKIAIANASADEWKHIRPRSFQEKLTKANQKNNNCLVPTIKLAKSIIGDLPEQQRLTGYHTESLCLDAVKRYQGSKTPKELLQRIFKHASKRVLKPIADVTGQSRIVDEYLGPANSQKRRIAADALSGIARRLQSARSIDQWKNILGV